MKTLRMVIIMLWLCANGLFVLLAIQTNSHDLGLGYIVGAVCSYMLYLSHPKQKRKRAIHWSQIPDAQKSVFGNILSTNLMEVKQ
jgi:multisubunit Na+/H+ antiporter MnhE subunit